MTSEIIESKIGHKRKDIKNGKKSQKTSEVDLLKNTKSSDNLVSNIKSSSKKKSSKKRVKIKGEDDNINDGKSFDVEEYIKTDLDDMDYDNAIKRDNRSFCGYFRDNLASDILILNIFCKHEPLNP